MGIKEEYKRYNEISGIFICPLCHGTVSFENVNSIICEKKHCFDLSKYGYINFLPNQKKQNTQKSFLKIVEEYLKMDFIRRYMK